MWNEGYTSEIDYVSGYYSELAPSRIKLALLSCGVDHSVPDDPAYLELGFGQGLSLNINAATNSGQFYGTDFNPGQVANARELARAMGKPLTLFEDSFEQLEQRTDLPQFDIIALHGIWSWIGEGSREAIVRILLDKLKPGGVVYISYNVTPGWSPAAPLRILLSEYGKREATGRLLERVEQSIGFVDKVIGANAAYFANNPGLKARLEQIKKQDRNYIAHEYFNAHWEPMPFAQVADRLSEAKLTFAASANIVENLPAVSNPPAARELLASIHDPIMRETTRDYFINQQFRRDLFVKGPRAIAPYELGKRVDKARFVLIGNPAKLPTKIKTAGGEANLRQEIHKPVVEALAKAPGNTATIGELLATKEAGSLHRRQIWDSLLILTEAGFVAPSSPSITPEADQQAAAALNEELLERAEATVGVGFLAAASLGAAVSVARMDQLFIRGLKLGEKDVPAYVYGILAAQNQRVLLDGKAVESKEGSLKELKRMFAEFNKDRLEFLKRLGIL